MTNSTASAATAETKSTTDAAAGHSRRNGNGHSAKKRIKTPESSSASLFSQILGRILQFLLLDVPLLVLFVLLMTTVVLHRLHDDYFYPLLKLMDWEGLDRDYLETTYYHRYCTGEDFTAKTVQELVITDNYTTKDAATHMLTHGVSVYPNLLTNETATTLREWIVQENGIQQGWDVIENTNRWSWGIDMTMHPSLQTFWEELSTNDKLLSGLEAIVGPNPAIIEFTAITSAYGAADQHLHADVVPPGSAAKYARSFIPSYSLFVPLQDTTYEMGATHVCPGSHLCSGGVSKHCTERTVAMSGPKGQGGVWNMGWGALVNQQTFHKGMGFTQEGAPDRVVLIATFAPRPLHHRGLETRMIGQGGSYSLLWNQWGHTFYDYVHANKRMTQPQATLRSLGVIKSDGITYLSSASMRMANEEVGMREDDLEDFIEGGGLSFLPKSWQGSFVGKESDISEFHSFVLGTLKRTKMKLESFNVLAVVIYLAVAVLWDASRKQSSISWTLLKRILWLAFLCGSVLVISWRVVRTVEESNWGKGIRAGKAYILPWVALDEERHGTLPHRSDVLLVPHYASTFMASYSHIIDVAHPGNKFWNEVVQEHVVGFAALPPLLQQQYCTHLIESIAAERRFLEQGSDRLWYNVTDAITLSRFCRKEILRAAHPLRGALSHELHSLRNDVDFGMFRSTGMQRTQIRDLLDDWETAILPYAETNAERIAWQVVNIQAKRSASFRPTISTVANAAKGLRELEEKSATGPSRHGTALPPRPSPSPPTPYAWLQEGDRINVMEGCNPGGVQYPGVIVATFPSHNFFDIEYDTGETDEEVKQRCVIPETEED